MYEVPLGAPLMPKAYGSSYSPAGVVFVPCFREVPSTRPFAPNRAVAEPAFTHRPLLRSHQVTMPEVALLFGATAVISWLPPPVSAMRAGSGSCPPSGAAPSTRRDADTRAVATAGEPMAQTVEGGSGNGSPGRPSRLVAMCSFLAK